MFELVADPVVFAPPEEEDVNVWVTRIADLGRLAADSYFRLSCPSSARDEAIALWYSEPRVAGGPSNYEFARMAHERASQLHVSPEFLEADPLLDAVSVDPAYENKRLGSRSQSDVEGHLAEAGCAKAEGRPHAGIFGPAESWARKPDSIEVEARILGRDHPLDGLIEADKDESLLREFLAHSSSVPGLLSACCEEPCVLLGSPQLGVRALWAVHFGGNPWELDFEIGPGFQESVLAMNYHHRPGEAKRCLRVMAQIAGGMGDQVEGHEERVTAAPTSPVQTDQDGNPVIRSRLQNRVADAHRLFWARGSRPTFLNVTGHEGKPAV